MGANVVPGGVSFTVWAPHALAAWVVGSFNGWSDHHPMAQVDDGHWQLTTADAGAGDEYKFRLQTESGAVDRADPYGRLLSNDSNSIVEESSFDWGGDNFRLADWNRLVIYELHVGTFSTSGSAAGSPGTFAAVARKLAYLGSLGVNAIEIMPVAEFAGERSWGYNPSHPFSVELSYGGSVELKKLVKLAHDHGIGVLLDVVYNHFGPSDLDLWQFDGWSEDGGGGIYFYNDDRAETPWGHTRPDYGRGEVRQFIVDNAMYWLDEFHMDGLRLDATEYISSIDGTGAHFLEDGWSLMQRITGEAGERVPRRLVIAEDMQGNDLLTRGRESSGAGFGAQWDADFVRELRHLAVSPDDDQRSVEKLAEILSTRDNSDSFSRIIFSESHDSVANGDARVPEEIAPGNAANWFSQKRSTLAAAIVMTAPGIPMIFQGQEFLESGWFRDDVPVDWSEGENYPGILRLYRDLIALRKDDSGVTRGLTGSSVEITHSSQENGVIVYRRSQDGGAGDDVIVVANFSVTTHRDYTVGFPAAGRWELRFNSDWGGYSDLFSNTNSVAADAGPGEYDGQTNRGEIVIGPYSVLIFSMNREG